MNGVAWLRVVMVSLLLVSGCAHPTSRNTTHNLTTNASSGRQTQSTPNTTSPYLKPLTQPGHVNVGSSAATSPTVSTPIRGVIEGFYGTPWTNQERMDMFRFMKSAHLNTYVYAPKDDPYQRTLWGSPYPGAEATQMKALIQGAASNDVQFVYSISPGIPAPLPGAKLTPQQMNQSITYSSEADRKKLENKINQMELLGVHTFMLSFDDIETMLKPADQKVYGKQYARAQMQLANQVLADERQWDPQFKLWFAPTSYYGLIDGPYWQTLRTRLNPSIQAVWTGKWVINTTITTAQAEEITKLYGRKPIIWDNYPVNDYTYNINKFHQLMMGPLQGRDAALLDHAAGYVSNPMLQPDASKLALLTIADYLQNPRGYHPLDAWDRALKHMPGVSNPTLFKIFAQYTSASPLNPAGYNPMAQMLAAYRNARSATQRRLAEDTIRSEFQTLASLPQTLSPTVSDKELLTEIRPWLMKLGEEGQGGMDALKELDEPSHQHQQTLKQDLNKETASPYQIGSHIIAFMQQIASHRS